MTDAAANEPRMLTFKTGGWVLLVTLIVCAALVAWAVTPAFLEGERAPGDGVNVESYGFDLSTLLVPRETLIPIMRRRDMVPVKHDPVIISAAEVQRINEEERGKYLVSRDRIIGVEINGEARAYPLILLIVHEVIHDELGGVPIAVTYTWPGDAVRVYDRRLGEEVLTFGVSGLASNANGLLYNVPEAESDERSEEDSDWRGTENLWSQLTGIAVAGPAAEAGLRLRTIPAQVVSWGHWTQMHPETTAVAREDRHAKRYRRATPDEYFRSPLLPPYAIDPIPDRESKPAWKDRVIVIHTGREEERRVYSLPMIAANARAAGGGESQVPGQGRWTWTDDLDGVELRFEYDEASNTAAVFADAPIYTAHCFWFAWYAAEQTLLTY